MVTFESDTLSKLCSKDQLLLLDSIDRLRLQGINNYISLPQIIVCGDQSSGKSSVLEAISGVAFPVKSNLCTRFPTELVLRRAPRTSVSVSIVPHESRSKEEQVALRAFREELDSFDTLPGLIERAKLEMGITAHGRGFAKDILRVEVTGPDRPHLTMVDLPGLIHSESRNQTVSDIELIRDVVQSYMREQRCIILAVVSAKNDFANQVVLKLARAADPTGNRTLGIITKPDTLVPGGNSEILYVSLARNQEVEFRHGWHVVKNMDSEKGTWSLSTRHAEEAEFFSSGAWSSLPFSSLGIDTLRGRLSKVLLRQIASELPGLMSEIKHKFASCQDRLQRLGAPRATLPEQQLYLFQLSQSYQELVKMAVAGTYSGPFFADAKTDTGSQQRIRAIVQNLNEEFASEMLQRGHSRQVIDTDLDEEPAPDHPNGPARITRDDFLNLIEKLMSRIRGRELPGQFNPLIVADLFMEQSRPWADIARRHVELLWATAARFVRLVVAHMAGRTTVAALQQKVIGPALNDILRAMRDKTDELLKSHQNNHPITYNHRFLEALQEVRNGRKGHDAEAILRNFFGVSSITAENDLSHTYWDLKRLAESLAERTRADTRRCAAIEALDCLTAYYQVARDRFIDDVAVEVVEAKLMTALDGILSPVSVFQMSPEQVTCIAGESEEARKLREQLTKQLEVLRDGLDTCKRFVGIQIHGDSVFTSHQETSGPRLDDSTYNFEHTPAMGLESGPCPPRADSPPLASGDDGAPPVAVAECIWASLDTAVETEGYGSSEPVQGRVKKNKKKKGLSWHTVMPASE